jgi:oligoendopeptidase F
VQPLETLAADLGVTGISAWGRLYDQVSGKLELYRRRRVEHFLEPAVFDAGISRRTLDSMLEAVRSRWEVPRRYLRRKARILGPAASIDLLESDLRRFEQATDALFG